MPRPSDPHAKSRLLEAAERVFSEKGLDRAKVEDITTQAGLSKGAFYLHFDSKGDAFKELLSEVIAHLQKRMDAVKAVCLPSLDRTSSRRSRNGWHAIWRCSNSSGRTAR